jgi:hypothetical protein
MDYVNAVLDVAPELKCFDTGTIERFITMAQRRISPQVFCTFYDDAVTYLAAHLITMSQRHGGAGAQTMQKVGDVEVQYANLAQGKKSDLSYLQTSYGIEYLALRDTAIGAYVTVV